MFQVIYTMFFKKAQDIITSSYVFDTYEEVVNFIKREIVKAENNYAKVHKKEYNNDIYVKIETSSTFMYYTLLEN